MNETKIIDSLRSLHDLSKTINSTLNIKEVEGMVMEKTSQLMKSGRVMILCLDRGEKVLNIHRTLGFDEKELRLKRFHNIRSFDHCIVHKGTVITMKELLPEKDFQANLKIMPFLADMVFAPLEIKGEAVGLLGVSDHKRDFSKIDLEIFCSLGSQAAVAMENANLYRRLKEAFLQTAEALAEAVNSRDPYTGGHVRRVVDYSLKIAKSLDLPDKETEDLRLAAILHDIGKIGIDDAILRKSGALDTNEKTMMKKHPAIGARILEHIEEMEGVIQGVRHHHERFNGSGYPDGLKGKNIPLNARIIAISDAFDALTTDRPYNRAIEKNAALKRLKEVGGTQFDPLLTEEFCLAMEEEEDED